MTAIESWAHGLLLQLMSAAGSLSLMQWLLTAALLGIVVALALMLWMRLPSADHPTSLEARDE